jgi:hypothetical protein
MVVAWVVHVFTTHMYVWVFESLDCNIQKEVALSNASKMLLILASLGNGNVLLPY